MTKNPFFQSCYIDTTFFKGKKTQESKYFVPASNKFLYPCTLCSFFSMDLENKILYVWILCPAD